MILRLPFGTIDVYRLVGLFEYISNFSLSTGGSPIIEEERKKLAEDFEYLMVNLNLGATLQSYNNDEETRYFQELVRHSLLDIFHKRYNTLLEAMDKASSGKMSPDRIKYAILSAHLKTCIANHERFKELHEDLRKRPCWDQRTNELVSCVERYFFDRMVQSKPKI